MGEKSAIKYSSTKFQSSGKKGAYEHKKSQTGITKLILIYSICSMGIIFVSNICSKRNIAYSIVVQSLYRYMASCT